MSSIEITKFTSAEEKVAIDRAMRAYRDGAVHGMLIIVARKARAYLAARYPSSHARLADLRSALDELAAAERAAGVDLTSPTEEDLGQGKPRRRKASRR